MKKEIEFYKKQLTINAIIGFLSVFFILIMPFYFKIIFVLLFIVSIVKGQMIKYKFDKAKAGIK